MTLGSTGWPARVAGLALLGGALWLWGWRSVGLALAAFWAALWVARSFPGRE